MNDEMFGIFIEMLICADPWPLSPEKLLVANKFADFEARKRGYTDWIDALHKHGKEPS